MSLQRYGLKHWNRSNSEQKTMQMLLLCCCMCVQIVRLRLYECVYAMHICVCVCFIVHFSKNKSVSHYMNRVFVLIPGMKLHLYDESFSEGRNESTNYDNKKE